MFVPDTEGFQLLIIFVQWNHFEESVVETQSDHSALWVNDSNQACL